MEQGSPIHQTLARVDPMSRDAAPAGAVAPESHRGIPRHVLIEDLSLACVSRALDDRELIMNKQSRVFFQISGAGHEALLVALARHLRPSYDWFFPYYRDRALVLGLGVTPGEMLLQSVGSADDPASGGRQMPSHWGSRRLNIVTQSSPTGSQCLPAVGCAEAARYIARRELKGCSAHGDELTYVSLGEGATSEGEFWESLNTAATLHLPVLYVVEDNGYALSVRREDQSPAPISEMVRGIRGLAVVTIDGRDYFDSWHRGAAAIARVRAGEGPCLVHATVTRPYSHSAADMQSKYRPPAELAEELAHDPIELLAAELVAAGIVTAEDVGRIRADAKAMVAACAKSALAARRPDPKSVTDHVIALPDIPPPPGNLRSVSEGALSFGDAITATLHELMAADERIRVFGEDVADGPEELLDQMDGKGGVFGTTHGLQKTFGIARCFNTPLAEANIIGRAVGQAVRGLKPCPEIQFFDFIWPAMTQIKSEAATTRWRSNGVFRCGLVVRVPIGGYLGGGGAIWHSQSGESIFTHVPGLIILFPSRARDAAGLLRAAFQCEDPVLFLEHKHLLNQRDCRDAPTPPDYVVPIGKGDFVVRGTDLTVVTWGATVRLAREAATTIAHDGGGAVEVIDLRSLLPWDQDLVAESVARTGRALVLHEDIENSGFGAEVASWIGQHCFGYLDAPVTRLGAKFCHVPYEPTLERAVLPQAADVVDAALALLRY